ncbi:MAG: hypothetical protein QS748_07725 [Candidatus Endonucleobacter bathymodioli]|uniref:Uncharacterized protein n=1 Tax=Candidatus Endonucleibacter bathymodioli TaxID=539814 RepID=A0AA90SXZ0_9GAMM|nr:hypothetical protein [Candidatus Endonucleobacter bathymodioli]
MINKHVNMAKIGAIVLMVSFSFANINQACAGLYKGPEKIFKKNNVKVILTGACIFISDECGMNPEDTSHGVSTELMPSVSAQHQDNHDAAIIITPFFRDIHPTHESYCEEPVAAMRQLFYGSSFDLRDRVKWDMYPENTVALASTSNRYMHSSAFYFSNTDECSSVARKFGCSSVYMGFANILSDTIDVKKLDGDIIVENNDDDYITKGAAYLNVKKGLSEITSTLEESTKVCHVVLPIFHAWKSESKTKELAVTAFCNHFLDGIEQHLKIPSVIYVSLFSHSDQDVTEISDFLLKDKFEIVDG